MKNLKSLAVVVALGFPIFFASQVSAAITVTSGTEMSISDWAGHGVVTIGDKDFTYLGSSTELGSLSVIGAIPVTFSGSGDLYTLTIATGADPILEGSYTLDYSIAINSPPSTDIILVSLTSAGNGGSPYGDVTVTKDVDGFGTLTSTDLNNGGTLLTSGSTLTIHEEFTLEDNFDIVPGLLRITAATNSFVQTQSTQASVPEPASLAVWTILAGVVAGARARRRFWFAA